MKVLLLRTAKLLGLFAVARRMTRRELRILGYHGIWFLDDHYGDRLFMSPDKFDARMRWLSRSPYRVVPLDQAVEQVLLGRIEANSVVITIDDGWFGTYKYMLPALERHTLSATLYVYTGAVDSQRPLANVLLPALLELSRTDVLWFQVDGGTPCSFHLSEPAGRARAAAAILGCLKELEDVRAAAVMRKVASDLGFDYDAIVSSRQFGFMTYGEIEDACQRGLNIQLHSHSHRLNVQAPESIRDEVIMNKDRLAPHVHFPLRHFCYPSGVHCREMYGYLERSGVLSATTVIPGFVTPKSNRYALNRILDGESTSELEFEAELSGLLELFRGAGRRLKAIMGVA